MCECGLTVQHVSKSAKEVLTGVLLWPLPLTGRLQDLLDLAEGSFLLFIQVFHSDGVAQLRRRGLQISEHRLEKRTLGHGDTGLHGKAMLHSLPEIYGHPGCWTPAGSSVSSFHRSQWSQLR